MRERIDTCTSDQRCDTRVLSETGWDDPGYGYRQPVTLAQVGKHWMLTTIDGTDVPVICCPWCGSKLSVDKSSQPAESEVDVEQEIDFEALIAALGKEN